MRYQITTTVTTSDDIGLAFHRLNAFQSGELSERAFNDWVRVLWIETEFPSEYKDHWEDIFMATTPKFLMSKSDKKLFREMSSPLTIYRGFAINDGDNPETGAEHLSWTTSKDKALMFSNRYPKPDANKVSYIATGTVSKGMAFGFFNDRKESEIVVKPEYISIENIERVG